MNIPSLKVDYDTPIETQLKALGITNYLDVSALTHLHDRPKDDTIYDVEDGTAMRNVSPMDARETFAKEERRGLTVQEGLALIRHNPDILKDHYIDFVGSRYDAKGVPRVYVYGEKPAFSNHWGDNAIPHWGAASCLSGIRTSEPRAEKEKGQMNITLALALFYLANAIGILAFDYDPGRLSIGVWALTLTIVFYSESTN